jgi:hypothetical protein
MSQFRLVRETTSRRSKQTAGDSTKMDEAKPRVRELSLGLACGGVNLCVVGTSILALKCNKKYHI